MRSNSIQTRAFWLEDKANIDVNGRAAFGIDAILGTLRAYHTSSKAILYVESNLSSGVTAEVSLLGEDSGGTRSTYADIQGQIQTNTAGAEVGRMNLRVSIAGALTSALELRGSTASDPLLVRVNSTLKAITEGAVDSGGSGFKVLRVPN